MAQTTFTDDGSGSGNLNGSTVGTSATATWDVLSGSATRSDGKFVFGQVPSAHPFAVVDVGNQLVDARVDTYTGFAGGDALYFRVSDASNWWRLRCRTSQSSGSYQASYYAFGNWEITSNYTEPVNIDRVYIGAGYQYSNYYPDASGTEQPTQRKTYDWADSGHTQIRVITENRPFFHPTITYTNDIRYLVLEKSVAGTLTQVGQWTVSAFATLRVTATAAGVIVYSTDAATQLATITDTFNATATKVGIGLGDTNDNYATASSLDNFSATIPPPPGPPVITSPSNNADVDITGTVTIVMANAATAADPQTAGDGRWRAEGDTDWTEIDGAFGTGQSWTFDVAGIVAPKQIEVQARWTDTQSTTPSGWSDSVFFTLRDAPTAPTFVSPASGATVVAADIAVVDYGTDSTARQARRVADVDGGPDNDTVYQAALTLIGPDSDGHYLLTGDASIHPTGAEHIQVRRQTAAGGTLWSQWTDLPVVMSQAQPFPPTVVYTAILASAYMQIAATFTPADSDHVDAVQFWVYRDGVRVAILDVTDNGPVAYLDLLPGSASDFRCAAVGANGTVAFADETSTVGTPDDSSPVLDDGTPSVPLGDMIT